MIQDRSFARLIGVWTVMVLVRPYVYSFSSMSCFVGKISVCLRRCAHHPDIYSSFGMARH